MASTQTIPNRLLGELLQEEQEPFILETYLSERGYRSKSELSNKSANSSSKLLKSVYKKLLLINKRLRINNCDDQVHVSVPEMTRNSKPVMDSQTCSDREPFISDLKTCKLKMDEAHTDRELSRRQSSVTKLYQRSKLNDDNDTATGKKENKSNPRSFKAKKVTEDSILSASLWALLVSSTTDKIQAAGLHGNGSGQFKAKRIMQQNKQLLFDCVREIIEKQRGEILGSEEIGKLVCQKIKEWGHGTSIIHLLNLDYQESIQEWNHFNMQKKELAVAIGDDILQELRNDLVIDMVDYLTLTHLSL